MKKRFSKSTNDTSPKPVKKEYTVEELIRLGVETNVLELADPPEKDEDNKKDKKE